MKKAKTKKVTKMKPIIVAGNILRSEKALIKYAKTEGKILTFKKEIIQHYTGKGKQIIVEEVETDEEGIQLLGALGSKSPVFKSDRELIKAIDWKWMAKCCEPSYRD